MMFVLKNTLIRATIQTLRDPNNWNPGGGYQHGKRCIVTACFWAAVDRSEHGSCNHLPALRAVRKAIEVRYGLTRGKEWNRRLRRDQADIIKFNDHPRTTHADVMSVLYQAEKNTRPFWRRSMAT